MGKSEHLVTNHEKFNYQYVVSQTMKAQTLWEYKFIYKKTRTDESQMESFLNDLGEQGWELVSVIFRLGIFMLGYIFKRPKL